MTSPQEDRQRLTRRALLIGGGKALCTMCIGGGQGIAALFEAM